MAIAEKVILKGKVKGETVTIISPNKNVFVFAERAMGHAGALEPFALSAFTPTVFC